MAYAANAYVIHGGHFLWSCLIGTALWTILKEQSEQIVSLCVPIEIADTTKAHCITPGYAYVTIQGPRLALRKFLQHNTTIIIDPTSLKRGLQEIVITNQQLLLPAPLTLVNYATIPIFFNPLS